MARGSDRLELTWYNKGQALIPAAEGRYDYRWADPRDPRVTEVRPLVYDDEVTGTRADVDPDQVYSEIADLDPTVENLAIRGESGDALRALVYQPELADRYRGRVKLCYIDPPFNTGELFGHYDDALEHSVWLSLMAQRLVLIKELLAEDGSVWVHLNDDENHRARMLLDEIFGPENFVAEVVWQKAYSPRNDSKGIPMVTDPILVYRKSEKFSPNKLPRTAEMDARYSNPDDDPKGPWKKADSTAPGGKSNQGMVYAIQHPVTGALLYPPAGRCWGIQQSALLEIMKGWGGYELVDLDDAEKRAEIAGMTPETVRAGVKGIVIPDWGPEDAEYARKVYEGGNWPAYTISGNGRGGFGRKIYLSDMGGRIPVNLLPYSEVGHTDGAKKEIQALFPGRNPFDTPKPERLLERIIHIATDPGDLVLDCFGGSGTTAAVAHKMARRWITVELSENTFSSFVVPRLTKVVTGADPGGITSTASARTDATAEGLPEGLSPEEAATLSSLLSKAVKHRDDLKGDPVLGEIRSMIRTRPGKAVVNWRGGGAFRTAHLAPAVLDYDEDLEMAFLSEAATDHDTLISAVAANLGFRRDLAPPGWHGVVQHRLLFVAEGHFTAEAAADLLERLPVEYSLTVAAASADPEAVGHIRTHGPRGSRTVLLPDGLVRR